MPRSLFLRRAALAAAALSLAACASVGGARSASVFDAPAPAPVGQTCSGGRWTAGLPPVDRLLDSASLASAAAALPNGHAVWEVRWDSAGAPDSVRVVETELGGSLLADAERAVRGAMRTVEPEVDTVDVPGGGRRVVRRGPAHLLRLDAGSPAALRLAEFEECAPVLANRASVQFRLIQEFRQAMAGSGQARRTLVLQVVVDPEGSAVGVDVVRSSGIARVDQLAVDLGRTMRFAPATVNRRPVRVLVSIPFTLIVGEDRGAQSGGWRDARGWNSEGT